MGSRGQAVARHLHRIPAVDAGHGVEKPGCAPLAAILGRRRDGVFHRPAASGLAAIAASVFGVSAFLAADDGMDRQFLPDRQASFGLQQRGDPAGFRLHHVRDAARRPAIWVRRGVRVVFHPADHGRGVWDGDERAVVHAIRAARRVLPAAAGGKPGELGGTDDAVCCARVRRADRAGLVAGGRRGRRGVPAPAGRRAAGGGLAPRSRDCGAR